MDSDDNDHIEDVIQDLENSSNGLPFQFRSLFNGYMYTYTKLEDDSELKPHTVIGFKNLGDTCAFNASLICLIHSKDLQNLLNKTILRHEDSNEDSNHLLASYMALINFYFSNNASSVNPKSLFDALPPLVFSSFCNGSQLDAFNCFQNLLKNLLTSYSRCNQQKSHLHSLFNIEIVKTLTCLNCYNFHEEYEVVNHLSLSIPIVDEPNLETCLQEFFKPKTIIPYYCGECDYTGNAIEELIIIKTPPNLVIHLQRFKCSNDDQWEKVKQKVNFDTTKLSIKDYIDDDLEDSPTYSCQSIINHSGDTKNGHWSALIKNDGSWFRVTDDLVSPFLDVDDVCSNKNYILFFHKN